MKTHVFRFSVYGDSASRPSQILQILDSFLFSKVNNPRIVIELVVTGQ